MPRLARARLLASWQRSEDYGVPLDAVDPVFTGTDDSSSLFFECGNEVLADLHRTLADEPVSLMLTDADGVVLNRLSRRPQPAAGTRRRAPRAGIRLLRARVGTNGLGLALADRVPTLVRAEEHYALSLCTFTCAAVPVLDPLDRAGWRAASTSPPGRARRATCCSRSPGRRPATPPR